MWQSRTIIPALRKLRQKDYHESNASMNCRARFCLKMKQNRNTKPNKENKEREAKTVLHANTMQDYTLLSAMVLLNCLLPKLVFLIHETQ